MKHLLIALTLLAVFMLIASYYVGGEVERIHQHLRDGMNPALPFAVDPGDFDRGLLASSARTRLVFSPQFKPSLLADTTLDLEHHVTHGPFPLMAWIQPNMPIHMAQTVIQTQVSEESTSILKLGLFGNLLSALRARAWVRLSGDTRMLIQLPAEPQLNRPTEKLQLAELSLRVTLTPEETLKDIEVVIGSLRWCRHLEEWRCLNLSARGEGETVRALHASGKLEIAKELLVSQIAASFQEGRRIARPTSENESAAFAVAGRQAQRQIALLVSAGILQEHQENYHLSFAWDEHGLRLNGMPRSWHRILPVISVVGAQLIGEV